MKLTLKRLKSLIKEEVTNMSGTQAYLVIGSSGSSGSATWPEDFDIVGVWTDKTTAQDIANEKNAGAAISPDEDDFDVDELHYEVVPVSLY